MTLPSASPVGFVPGGEMTVEDAKKYGNREITRIEAENPAGVLQPWDRDACNAAGEHWGRVQQRIALSRSNPQNRACCDSLNLDIPARTDAQLAVAAQNGARLAARHAQIAL
jgi:hypothetical protein